MAATIYMITGRHEGVRYTSLSKMWDSQLVYILWNSIGLTSIIVTELANTMKYGGGGLI